MLEGAVDIHLINPLENAFGGSELRTFAYFRELSGAANVTLWSEYSPARELQQAAPISRLAEDSHPVGGTLVFVGCYFKVGEWLQHARPARVIVVVNTPSIDPIRGFLAELLQRGAPEPELIYAAKWLREALGKPGIVDFSPIDLLRFQARRQRPDLHTFRMGRLSRDALGKHHPHDPLLYEQAIAIGIKVELMGANCLYRASASLPAGLRLLAVGSVPAEVFLNRLDCFFYRTHPIWKEPHGRVVTEAMACALPVVCDRKGGYCEFVRNGENGFLFSGNDEAIEILNYLRHAPEVCRQIGAAARQTIIDLHANRHGFLEYCCRQSP